MAVARFMRNEVDMRRMRNERSSDDYNWQVFERDVDERAWMGCWVLFIRSLRRGGDLGSQKF